MTPNLITPEALQSQFLHSENLALNHIRCSPYHQRDSCVIAGDAAHAISPFYGQGMNTGFEDVRILFEEFLDESSLLSSHMTFTIVPSKSADAPLQASSTFCQPDAHAMNELALQHYKTLCVGVVSYSSRVRDIIEERLIV